MALHSNGPVHEDGLADAKKTEKGREGIGKRVEMSKRDIQHHEIIKNCREALLTSAKRKSASMSVFICVCVWEFVCVGVVLYVTFE